MLRLGGLRTAAILRAPGKLVLHNAGAHLDSAPVRTAYRGAGFSSSLEMSESRWSVGRILGRFGLTGVPDKKGRDNEN